MKFETHPLIRIPNLKDFDLLNSSLHPNLIKKFSVVIRIIDHYLAICLVYIQKMVLTAIPFSNKLIKIALSLHCIC